MLVLKAISMGENTTTVPGTGEGPMFLLNRTWSAIRDDRLVDLLDEGIIGHLDFGTMASLDPEMVDNPAATGALKNAQEASRRGAYVVSFTEDWGRVQFSYVSPGSLRFDPYDNNGEDVILKNFEADRTGVVTKSNFSSYDELMEDVLKDKQRLVWNKFNDDSERAAFKRLFMEADSLGLVQ